MGIYDLDLQELPLFEGLKADEVEQFIQATEAKVKRYGKEVRILKAYETNSRIGIIVEGEALVLAEDRFGNETVGHRLERGALFGSTTAILPGYASPTAIEAVSDVLVLWVPYTALLVAGPRLGRIHGIVMRNLLVAFCRKNVLMMQKLEVLSQKTARAADPLPAAAGGPPEDGLRQSAGAGAARQGTRVQQERPDPRDRPDEGEGALRMRPGLDASRRGAPSRGEVIVWSA